MKDYGIPIPLVCTKYGICKVKEANGTSITPYMYAFSNVGYLMMELSGYGMDGMDGIDLKLDDTGRYWMIHDT